MFFEACDIYNPCYVSTAYSLALSRHSSNSFENVECITVYILRRLFNVVLRHV